MKTVFKGGYVHTPADPHATAIAIEDQIIVWTGDDDAAEHFLDAADVTVELDGRLVTPAFVDARQHGAASLEVSSAKGIGVVLADDDVAELQATLVEPLVAPAAYASLMREGVALAFGSDDPWAAIRAAVWHPDEAERITVRAAFNAHTRGGWRAAGRSDGGVIAPAAPAYLAVWDVPGELVVQTPDERVAAWSTDTRAGVPLLPAIVPGEPLPTCWLTVVGGVAVYDPSGAMPGG